MHLNKFIGLYGYGNHPIYIRIKLNPTYFKIMRIARKLTKSAYKLKINNRYCIEFKDAAALCAVPVDFIVYWKNIIASAICDKKHVYTATAVDYFEIRIHGTQPKGSDKKKSTTDFIADEFSPVNYYIK